MRLFDLLLFSGLIFFSSVACSQHFYKWTDEQGQVHYTNEPPPDQLPAEIQIQKRLTDEQLRHIKERSAQQEQANKKLIAEKEKQRQQQAAKEKIAAQRCANAQDKLDFLRNKSSGLRLYKKDTHEQRQYISDEERAQLVRQWQQEVSEWCEA